jgi:hypothetical protein
MSNISFRMARAVELDLFKDESEVSDISFGPTKSKRTISYSNFKDRMYRPY